MCRKRPAARAGWDAAVLAEMRENITRQLRDFWVAGIRGPDFVWAATGPALEAFSKHPVVKKADAPGERLAVSDFLREVRRFVVDFVVGRVLTHDGDTQVTSGLDDVTTYYLLHRNDFGMGDAPAGACILYALSCNLSDRELTDRYDVLSRGRRPSGGEAGHDDPEFDEDAGPADGPGTIDSAGSTDGPGGGSRVALKPWSRRTARSLGDPAPDGRPPPLIDQAHRLMHLWRAGEEARVNDYLDDRGLKRHALFAQPAAGPDRARRRGFRRTCHPGVALEPRRRPRRPGAATPAEAAATRRRTVTRTHGLRYAGHAIFSPMRLHIALDDTLVNEIDRRPRPPAKRLHRRADPARSQEGGGDGTTSKPAPPSARHRPRLRRRPRGLGAATALCRPLAARVDRWPACSWNRSCSSKPSAAGRPARV